MKHAEIIWNALVESILEIFPEFSVRQLLRTDSLKDLGANSIDRAEVVMLTMSRLGIKAPLILFASAKNLGELSEAFLANTVTGHV